MRRLLLIAAVLLAATFVAAGVRASRTVEPRVGFVAYSGSVPTPHTLDGMAFVGFLRADRKLPIRGRVRYISPTQGPATVLRSFGREDYDLVVAMDRKNRWFLEELAPDDDAKVKIVMLRSYDPSAKARGEPRDSTETYSEGRARTRQTYRPAQSILRPQSS